MTATRIVNGGVLNDFSEGLAPRMPKLLKHVYSDSVCTLVKCLRSGWCEGTFGLDVLPMDQWSLQAETNGTRLVNFKELCRISG